ncbi:protein FAM3A-like isoform X2 [Lethenteron reissneri]|uniref:protein FAM3A-like isoform X2 n=1 Tax=Lethenteron reissneri TaxID=7753 RepID=UPI002AB643B1|nr:protein FAM3A-like isoform X2 [Lethenteron reissneri]
MLTTSPGMQEVGGSIPTLWAFCIFGVCVSPSPRGQLRHFLLVLCSLGIVYFVITDVFISSMEKSSRIHRLMAEVKRQINPNPPAKRGNVCGLQSPCPPHHFSFSIDSGAGNFLGPTLCFNDEILMSTVLNNVGFGINIALVNGTSGKMLATSYFNTFNGDDAGMVNFLRSMRPGTIVMLASFHDPATRLNTTARQLLTELGSSVARVLKRRDSWAFVGAKGIRGKSPFEMHVRSIPKKNLYLNWPEMLQMEGCIPERTWPGHKNATSPPHAKPAMGAKHTRNVTANVPHGAERGR